MAFRLSLDEANGQYTFTVVEGVDGGPTSTLVDLTDASNIHGGNVGALLIDVYLDTDSGADAVLVASGTGSSADDTVNYNANAMGVGQGCKVDPGDVLQLAYHEGSHTNVGDLKEMAQAEVSAWHLDAGETGAWTAYLDGVAVGSGTFSGTAAKFDTFTVKPTEIDPATGKLYTAFDTIEFTSPDGTSEYGINQISISDREIFNGADQTLTFGFGLTDADLDPAGGAFSVTFDADQSTPDPVSDPPAAADDYASTEAKSATANIVLVVDTSGSMGDTIGSNQTRLDLVQDAVQNLLNTYGSSLNQVMIVEFNDGASVLTSNGQAWMTGEQAISQVNNLADGGYTDYDSALAAVQSHYGTPPAADNTFIYFLSDGEPTSSDNGNPNTISATERASWTKFMEDKGIDEAYAVGIGPGVSQTDSDLQQVAWSSDGAHNDNVVLVTDETQLSGTLQNIAETVYGNVLTNDTDTDGSPLTVTTVNSQELSGPMTLAGAYGSLQIQADGDFNYQPTDPGQHGYEVFTYTATDNVGQSNDAHLVIQVNSNAGDQLLQGTEGDNSLQGGAGNDALIGRAGDDLLAGGGGLDLLVGDEGQDIFAFSAQGGEGQDIVLDFEVGPTGDVLSFYDVLDENGDAVLSLDDLNVSVAVTGADVELTISGDHGDTQVTLEGINSGHAFDGATTLQQLVDHGVNVQIDSI